MKLLAVIIDVTKLSKETFRELLDRSTYYAKIKEADFDMVTDAIDGIQGQQSGKYTIINGAYYCQDHGYKNCLDCFEQHNQAAQQLGSLGGKATKAKHGKEHYQKLAENMNRKRAEKKKLKENGRL